MGLPYNKLIGLICSYEFAIIILKMTMHIIDKEYTKVEQYRRVARKRSLIVHLQMLNIPRVGLYLPIQSLDPECP